MKIQTTQLASLIALAAISTLSPAQADVGSDVAKRLTDLYNATPKDCGKSSSPAFLCSGVLLRAVKPSTARQFYSINPAAVARGGVSASYLRKDAKFQHMAFGMTSGFIFEEILKNPKDHINVLCAFPLDAGTDARTTGSCGDSSFTTSAEDYCDRMGITTAEQWVALFKKNPPTDLNVQRGATCGFDVRNEKNVGTAEAFYQMIRATSMVPAEKFAGQKYQENEVLIAPWRYDAPNAPAVSASFHVGPDGLEGARLYQIQWFQATKRFMPVISLALPQTPQQDAAFTFVADNQAIFQVTQADACPKYVQSAKWVKRFDARFNKEIFSLDVTPTDCGRRILSEQTNNFLNELVANYYLQPEWINNPDNKTNKVNSMRRQLVCNITTARAKTTWTLEPSRPYTTHANSVAQGCDNV